MTIRDSRQKAHLAEQLEAQCLALPELLANLSRDRLKELCRALGLDDGGKEEAAKGTNQRDSPRPALC